MTTPPAEPVDDRQQPPLVRLRYTVVLLFADRSPHLIGTDDLGQAEDFAVAAAHDFPNLASVPIYEWDGREFKLLQTLEIDPLERS